MSPECRSVYIFSRVITYYRDSWRLQLLPSNCAVIWNLQLTQSFSVSSLDPFSRIEKLFVIEDIFKQCFFLSCLSGLFWVCFVFLVNCGIVVLKITHNTSIFILAKIINVNIIKLYTALIILNIIWQLFKQHDERRRKKFQVWCNFQISREVDFHVSWYTSVMEIWDMNTICVWY